MPDGGNVTIFGDIADEFDALVAYDEKVIDGFVEDSGYSLGAMAFWSVVSASMKLAQSFVDVGRLGNGVFVEGGWVGLGKDVLRGVNMVGTAGAVVGGIGRKLQLVQAGSTCAWTSAANAARLTGQRWFVHARELAEKVGIGPEAWSAIQLGGTPIAMYDKIALALTRMKVLWETVPAKSVAEVVAAAAKNKGSALMFSVRVGKEGHTMFATWQRGVGVVIRDPNGRVFKTVGAMQKVYGTGDLIADATPLLVKGAVLTKVSQAAQAATEVKAAVEGVLPLAFQVLPLIGVKAGGPATAAQAIQARDGAGASGTRHAVQSGETLSKIAARYYDGQSAKWPVIYYSNRKAIGNDPGRVRAGQVLTVPKLPKVRGPNDKGGAKNSQIPMS